MSGKKSFKVAKCYATKKADAKFKFILHLAVSVKIPVEQDGKVIGYDESTKYLRKGSQFEVAEDSQLELEIARYDVKSFDTEWADEETGELRQGVEHWLTPKATV